MALLEIQIRDNEGNKKTYVKDYINGFKVKNIMKYGAKLEAGEIDEIEAMDEGAKLIADLFDNPEVTYDTIMNGLVYDPDKGFVNTISEVLLTVMNGRDYAKKVMEAQMASL